MRVISGKAKGHKLKTPKGNKVRPTEDRIKESLFNIIGNIKNDDLVLDAFGGSGSIGIEFLSRGARCVYFVDNYVESIATIKENLNHTKMLDSSQVIKSDIFSAFKKFNKNNLKFDFIYLDPPFNVDGLVDRVFKAINMEDILDDNGIIIIEHEKNLSLEDLLYGFKKVDSRKYGSKSIEFFKKSI